MRSKPNRITISNAVRLATWINEHKEILPKLSIQQAVKRASEDLELDISLSSFRNVSKDSGIVFKRKTPKSSAHTTREMRSILLSLCKAILTEGDPLIERAQKLLDSAKGIPANHDQH